MKIKFTLVFLLTSIGALLWNNFPVKAQWNIDFPSIYSLPGNMQISQNSSLSQIQQSVHQQINQYRISQGLNPLELDSRISEEEQNYAQQMADAGNLLHHQGFDQRAQKVLQTKSYRGYSYAENEYMCSGSACNNDPATAAVQAWINSPGHRENILTQAEVTGIGVALNSRGEYYLSQMFIHTH